MHFEVLGIGKAPHICFVFGWNKKQILGALPDPSTPKCIPKGILVGNPPWPGLYTQARVCVFTRARVGPGSAVERTRAPRRLQAGFADAPGV